MTFVLIAVPFLLVALALLATAVHTAEYRWLTLGFGAAALVVGAYSAWFAWFAPSTRTAPAPGTDLSTQEVGAHLAARARVAQDEDTPEQMITKLGCSVCHQIPGVTSARSGVEGPLLVARHTAAKRLDSAEYQAAIRSGRATARTPEDYVRESILLPDAFIVPGFEQRDAPERSAMPDHFKATFTVAGLGKLIEYLLSLDCGDAARDNLPGPRVEPIDAVCH